MVSCARCGLWCPVDMLGVLHEAAKCYDQGRIVAHDWRGKGDKPWPPSA